MSIDGKRTYFDIGPTVSPHLQGGYHGRPSQNIGGGKNKFQLQQQQQQQQHDGIGKGQNNGKTIYDNFWIAQLWQ